MAAGVIFLEQEGGGLVKMTEQPYEAEARLQDLLARYPDLLPGDQIDDRAPRRWLLVAQEVGIADADAAGDRWSLDHLFLDQDATPTFVEVKRSSDTRIRREVVGQLLEYAANARYWRIDRMRELFALSCDRRGTDPAEEVRSFLGEDGDPEEFWAAAKRNLDAGRIRLLFVADVIPAPLRAVIEFLNRHMNPVQVLGVEVRQFRGGTAAQPVTTFVPRVLGQTEEAKQRKDAAPSQAGPIDEEDFYRALGDDVRANIRALAEHLRDGGYGIRADRKPSGIRHLHFVLPPSGVKTFWVSSDFGGWVGLGVPRQHTDELRRRLRALMPRRTKNIDAAKPYVGVPFDLFADQTFSRAIAELVMWIRSILLATEGTEGVPVLEGDSSTRLPED